MARPTEPITLLVLRKTKLGETDLIITGFSDEGVQVRAVAKGARRPGSRLGSNLELYSVARVLVYRSKGLDIITESQGITSNQQVRSDVLHSAGAAIIVEFLEKATRDGMEEPRLFPLSVEALRCVGAVGENGIALICAAALWKMSAQLGFAPQLGECIRCGRKLIVRRTEGTTPSHESLHAPTPFAPQEASSENLAVRNPGVFAFSLTQGGAICSECCEQGGGGEDALPGADRIEWIRALIGSRFIDLEPLAHGEESQAGPGLLRLAGEWLSIHLNIRLKSLDFLLKLG
ncbi:MAG: DNA repair protein RecO [Coriobacteriales bacterium]|jgi:DNA repair protein RecO (recombination protein O)|nr:DNA repair protein RecO [Coriobacteriales bacterium]